MNLDKIMSLFALFSKQSSAEYLPLVMLSMAEVGNRLKPGANKEDQRLCALCAAVANLHFAEADAAREKQLLTSAGNVAVSPGSTRYKAARDMADGYCAACADLLEDRAFLFFGTPG